MINFLIGIIIGAIVWECARYGSRWILYFKEKWPVRRSRSMTPSTRTNTRNTHKDSATHKTLSGLRIADQQGRGHKPYHHPRNR